MGSDLLRNCKYIYTDFICQFIIMGKTIAKLHRCSHNAANTMFLMYIHIHIYSRYAIHICMTLSTGPWGSLATIKVIRVCDMVL